MWASLAQIALLLAVGALVWLWFDSLKVRERALAFGKRACRGHGLQFLDETVVGVSLWPARNELGRMVLRRVYRFEFSDDGHNRRAGSIVMLGTELASLTLEPFLMQ
jgi:hypothetical protein